MMKRLLSFLKDHSDSISLLRPPAVGGRAIINAQSSLGNSRPFHAQRKTLVSSSWLDQTTNFRQEIRQSNYRNNPVKYDLDNGKVVREYTSTFHEFNFDCFWRT